MVGELADKYQCVAQDKSFATLTATTELKPKENIASPVFWSNGWRQYITVVEWCDTVMCRQESNNPFAAMEPVILNSEYQVCNHYDIFTLSILPRNDICIAITSTTSGSRTLHLFTHWIEIDYTQRKVVAHWQELLYVLWICVRVIHMSDYWFQIKLQWKFSTVFFYYQKA